MTKYTTLPKISSPAAPTDEDLAALAALGDEERRRLIEAEIEKGLAGKARKAAAKDIVAAVRARRRDG